MQKLSTFLYSWKKELITLVVILLCLFFTVTFPLNDVFQLVLRSFLFLLVLPVLYIRFVLKKNLASFGLNLSSPKKGLFWAFIMLLTSFLIASILCYFAGLETKYVVPVPIIANFWFFVLYEAVALPILLFLLGFFFQGFVQTTLKKGFGIFSFLLQFFLFLGFLFSIGKLSWQYTPLIILSLTGGFVTHKSGSFFYSLLMGIIFILFLDLYMIELVK